MGRRSLRHLPLLFFIIAIFARQSTGAPNAQVSFTDVGKISYSTSVNSLQLAGPAIDTADQSSQLDSAKAFVIKFEEHFKSYKKYVSPDRNLEFAFELQDSPRETLARSPTETWILSSLPQIQRAHAPPMTDVLFLHIGATLFKGANTFERYNSYQHSGGLGFNSLRTP
jgi:hypothetical protein